MKLEINFMESPPQDDKPSQSISKIESHKRDLIGDDVLDDFLKESDFTSNKKMPMDIFALS